MNFSDLGLDKQLLKAVQRVDFIHPTPVQCQTIPLILSGVDVVGQAQTGTGKTAAFGLPLLQKIDYAQAGTQVLVISPTRELAMQTQQELYRLGKEKRAKVQVVYGGTPISKQIKQLKNYPPHILVGTPGRLRDHLERKTLSLKNIKTLVLDEADEMLDMGFLDDICKIITYLSSNHQTLLFSATMPPKILKIGKTLMDHPAIVKVQNKELTTNLVTQYFVKSREDEKLTLLNNLLTIQMPQTAIVFGRTKRRVSELTQILQSKGHNVVSLHSDFSQQKRTMIMKNFRNKKVNILVATDIAARGLDIPKVDYVYNYDIPQNPDNYVHRIGRSGRAGVQGTSITFITPDERRYLRAIEKLTKKRMIPLRPPTNEELVIDQIEKLYADIDQNISQVKVTQYLPYIQKLEKQYPVTELLAYFLDRIVENDSGRSTLADKFKIQRAQ